MPIGRKIKNLREKMGINQSQLTCDILSRTVLSKIENDRMLPSIPQLQHVADKFNVSVSYFFDKSIDKSVLYPGRAKIPEDMKLIHLFNDKNYYKIIDEFEDGNLDSNADMNKYFYIGMSYYDLGKYKNSNANLRKYVKLYSGYEDDVKIYLSEKYAAALNTLCKLMLKNNCYDRALSCLYQAKENLDKYNMVTKRIYFTITYNIGSIYLMQNRYERIIELLENFISKNTTLIYTDIAAAIHLLLNISYYNLGDYNKSIEHVNRAIFLYLYSNCENDAIESYLNHINAFRYNNQFEEAFRILNDYKNICKDKRSDRLDNRFLLQEMILYFNLEDYDKTVSISKSIKISILNNVSKANLYFMMGHINFTRKYLNLSRIQLLKCENHFIRKRYYYDLVILYSDLYEICRNDEYRFKMEYFKNMKDARKNIWRL